MKYYKEDVVGARVETLWPLVDGGNEWFGGLVVEYNVKMKGTERKGSHVIAYDSDGSEHSSDLQDLEQKGLLRWPQLHFPTLVTSVVYGEEVVGAQVEILFTVDYDGEMTAVEWFGGLIVEYSATMKGTQMEKLHFIKFDDGDELYMDLQDLETQASVRWPEADFPTLVASLTDKEDVVGARVETLWPLVGGGNEWFGGLIAEYNVKLNGTQQEGSHVIAYDDGSAHSSDLQDLEQQGLLRWPQVHFTTQVTSAVYGEEVVGARVEILFSVDCDGEMTVAEWYGGLIVEYSAKMNGSHMGKLHFIKFDDGDELYMDLQDLETQASVRWPQIDLGLWSQADFPSLVASE